MGRHAGYLSLMAALVTGAEYVFVPEAPPCCNEPADSPLTWQRGEAAHARGASGG